MKLLFLGTSAGVPTPKRNVTALALKESQGKGWYLIDCGEATQHQILRTSLSINSLKGIFITHIHGDHCYGLPGVLASAAMNGRKEPLRIIAPVGIKEWLKATMAHTGLYLSFELEFLDSESLPMATFDEISVTTWPLSHRVPSYAYRFIERDTNPGLDIEKLMKDGIERGPIWGQISKGIDVEYDGQVIQSQNYLIDKNPPRSIVVAGDNDTPSLLAECCKNCQVLVHEATYTKEIAAKIDPIVGHSYAQLVAEFAEQVRIPNLVLTHFSPRYQLQRRNGTLSVADIYDEAAEYFKGHLFLARDYAEFQLHNNGLFEQLTDS